MPMFGKVYEKRKLMINVGKSRVMRLSILEEQEPFKIKLNGRVLGEKYWDQTFPPVLRLQ